MAQMATITSDIVPVSCGPLLGRLHMRAFLCPGIHQECIELEDSGTMVTPKAFSLMGDKGRLKDWKNALRINGLSLRKRMEIGDIDFYNHDVSCTGRCASRHVGNSKYEAKIESLKLAQEHDLLTVPGLLTNTTGAEHGYTVLRQVLGDRAAEAEVGQEQIFVKQEPISDYEYLDHTPSTAVVTPTSTVKLSAGKSSGKWIGKCKPKIVSVTTAAPEAVVFDFPETGDILEESQSFWKGIMDIGLLDPFVREIKTALDSMKNDLRRGVHFNETSKKMSQIVTELGLVTKLKFRLAQHKSETEKQKMSLVQEIEALRRKVVETEQKQMELKRKSDCFDQLIEMGRNKRVNVGNSSSGASFIHVAPTSEAPSSEEEENELGVSGTLELIPKSESSDQLVSLGRRKRKGAGNNSAEILAREAESSDVEEEEVIETEEKQMELKRKSDCFDQLMEMGRNKRVNVGNSSSGASYIQVAPTSEAPSSEEEENELGVSGTLELIPNSESSDQLVSLGRRKRKGAGNNSAEILAREAESSDEEEEKEDDVDERDKDENL